MLIASQHWSLCWRSMGTLCMFRVISCLKTQTTNLAFSSNIMHVANSAAGPSTPCLFLLTLQSHLERLWAGFHPCCSTEAPLVRVTAGFRVVTFLFVKHFLHFAFVPSVLWFSAHLTGCFLPLAVLPVPYSFSPF